MAGDGYPHRHLPYGIKKKKMTPLKILLGNNTLSFLGGSETWTATLAKELKRKGHLVHGFSPELGIIAQDLEKNGIPCFADISTSGLRPFNLVLEPQVEHDYDVIIANHFHIVEHLRLRFPNTPIISTVHGIIHKVGNDRAPEHPALEAGVNQFVSVSEEIQEMLKKEYNLDSYLVRNFFDINKFKARRKLSPKPKQILVNTNYAGREDPSIKMLREVATKLGAKLSAVGMNFSPTLDITKAIEDADIVVGMGRSVLEGVAAGRIGIVHGRWGTGGVITASNVEELRKCNFSGRNSGGKVMTVDEMVEDINSHYAQSLADWGVDYVRREHNAALAADQFVQMAYELMGGKKNVERIIKLKVRRDE